MNKNLLKEFMENGISISNDPEMFSLIEPIVDLQNYTPSNSSNYYLVAKRNTILNDILEKTSKMLSEKYFQVKLENNNLYTPIGPLKLIKSTLWKGLDDEANDWHNDYCDVDVFCDLAFLCYFNDFSPETGGEFQFKNVNKSENITKIYPKKYDIILFNQQLDWNHRVTPLKNSTVERTVMLFGYAFGI